MSTHPNAILVLALTPDGTTRKTFRAICAEEGVTPDDSTKIKVGRSYYWIDVMEGDYHDDFQISAIEGDIIIFDMVTYGYGEIIEWDKLVTQKAALEVWAVGICERHACTARFFVTSNYW